MPSPASSPTCGSSRSTWRARAYLTSRKTSRAHVYRDEEAGYLAGYLAALVESRTPGKHVISAVGGIPFEGVNRWTVGYRAGAKKADPKVTVKVGYSSDFNNPSKCRRVAARAGTGRGLGR